LIDSDHPRLIKSDFFVLRIAHHCWAVDVDPEGRLSCYGDC